MLIAIISKENLETLCLHLGGSNEGGHYVMTIKGQFWFRYWMFLNLFDRFDQVRLLFSIYSGPFSIYNGWDGRLYCASIIRSFSSLQIIPKS